MNLINELKDRNFVSEMRDDIASNETPVVLYGAADAAGFVYKLLAENGIKVDAVAVDKEYLGNRPSAILEKHEILSMDDVISKYDEVSLIIGFYAIGLPEIVRSKIQSYAVAGLRVKKVYLVDYQLAMRPERVFTYRNVVANGDRFDVLFNRLEDELSKRTMIAFLNQRISMEIGELDKVLDPDQYFPQSVVKFGPEEVFVDCGAFDGDSIQMFLEALRVRGIQDYRGIFAFEPDGLNYSKLITASENLHDVHVVKKGAWFRDDQLSFATDEVKCSEINDGGAETIDVTTIDKVVGNHPVTFIKMDIQGAEYEALLGAEKTISRNKPVLAICVYHREDDLIRLPELILRFVPNYKLYLRAHHSRAGELVLYALHS